MLTSMTSITYPSSDPRPSRVPSRSERILLNDRPTDSTPRKSPGRLSLLLAMRTSRHGSTGSCPLLLIRHSNLKSRPPTTRTLTLPNSTIYQTSSDGIPSISTSQWTGCTLCTLSLEQETRPLSKGLACSSLPLENPWIPIPPSTPPMVIS